MNYYLAVDIGASSGRHILSCVENGKIVLEEVFRFDNTQVRKDGHDCWDIEKLFSNILIGLQKCNEIGKIPKSVGIDTWAVDFMLIDENGKAISDAVAYRDDRTIGMKEKVDEILPFSELYTKTGIQYQPFNTIYQLFSLKNSDILEKTDKMLLIPDYLNFLLTGKIATEYTNATSTSLVNAKSCDWDFEIIDKLGFPRKIFAEIKQSGENFGTLSHEIAEEIGYNCDVILPATHDTGSAFLAVPALDENSVYISSGTWSLLGVVNNEPITSVESLEQNFTNEGGYEKKYRYLKNIMGLWMVQSIERELNGKNYIEGKEERLRAEKQYTFAELCELASENSDFPSVVDVSSDTFLAPESMTKAVKDFCKNSGQKVPETVGELMHCVYHSLAVSYKETIKDLKKITGKIYKSINIVGGGSNAIYLNELCVKETGLKVFAGPSEGTALGNAIVQMIHFGEFENVLEAKKCILNSFEIKTFN